MRGAVTTATFATQIAHPSAPLSADSLAATAATLLPTLSVDPTLLSPEILSCALPLFLSHSQRTDCLGGYTAE